MPRQYNFKFEVIAHSAGKPDLVRVEELIDLSMQELVLDDQFADALGEGQAITIRVIPEGEVQINELPPIERSNG